LIGAFDSLLDWLTLGVETPPKLTFEDAISVVYVLMLKYIYTDNKQQNYLKMYSLLTIASFQ